MDILKFRVRGQALTLINPNIKLIPVTDTVNQYLCQFEFSEDWDGLNKVVVFKNVSYNITKEVYLSTSNECYIPWEVLSNSGDIFLEVIGTEVRGEVVTVRLPSTLLGFKWHIQEGLLDVSANVSPTPDLFEQFVSSVRDDSIVATTARDEAVIARDVAVQSAADASASELAATSAAESAVNSASTASSAASSASESALSVAGVADETKSYAETASAKAADASTQAEIAAGAKEAAVTAKAGAEAARDEAATSADLAQITESHIKTMTVSAHSLAETEAPTVTKTDTSTGFALDFGIPKGATGPKGEDGDNIHYTWVKYADTPTSGMSDNPTGKAYIGIAYNKSTPVGSTVYSDYAWSRIKGEAGEDGYSPTVTIGTSSDGSTTVTVINKDSTTTTELVDGTARASVDSLSNSVSTRMSAIETEQSVQSGRMDTLKFVDSLDLARFPFLTFKDISDGRVSTQGMCVADGYLIITKFKSNSDATRFYVIDIDTREYVTYYEYVTGHSNCLAYGNGNIYIADSSNVYVIPFSNGVMGAMVTKQTSFSATAVAYNPSNNKLYFRVYLSEGGHAIYESDTSLSDAAVICNIVAPISNLTSQGFGCDGEYLYELTSGADRVERVLVYSMEGELVKCFEIPRDTFMEVEDIDFYNGYMFLNFNGSHSSYPPYVMCVPYLMDTAPSNISTVWSAINTNYNETELLDLYLDNTAEIAFPDGTSAKPFNTLFHAKTFIKNMRVPVKLNVSGTYTIFNIRHITAAPLMLAFVDTQITNLQVFRCSNVILTGSATLKTLKVEQGNCYCVSTSIVFVGDASTDAISVNRGMLTGYVGSMTTYASAVRALQGIVNISISSRTDVSDVNNSVHSMVCVDGTMQP